MTKATSVQPKARQSQLVIVAALLAILTALVIFSTSCGGGATEAVPNTVSAPALSLSSASLSFGSEPVDKSSSIQSITLTNTGNAALSITGLAATGANASDFAQTNTCGGSVAAGAECTIGVTFTPTAAGTRSGSLSISDNAVSSPQTVSLSGTGTGTEPAVSLSLTSMAFANQAVGTISTPQIVTLTNTGAVALSVSSLALTGANAGDFTQSNTCVNSIAAGTPCTISVTFTPATSGARMAILSIADNATGSPQMVNLSGTGTAAAVSLSPTSLGFFSQPVGTTSAAQIVTLTNSGNGALNLTSVVLTGTNASDFAQTNTCGNSVAAGAFCTISVTFSPSASGDRAAVLSIADNASGSPQAVSLSGTDTAAAVIIAPTAVAFTDQPVGATSAPQSVSLTNNGNETLTISNVSTSGDYTQTNNCGTSVAAGASCTISVTLTPTATGTLQGILNVTDNAKGSPHRVGLSGVGSAPVAGVTAASLTFNSQNLGTTSAAQTVTLNNTGNATLNISGITLTGTNSGNYAQANTCGNSVAASNSCTISVTMTPSATGTRTAKLTITDNSNNVSGSTQTVSLSGTGAGAGVSLSPASLPFGGQPVGVASGSQSLTLTNTGNTSLTLTGITLTGANAGDFTQTNTCGSAEVANGTCTISVTFTPAASGNRSASLTIADNATGSPQSIPLTGSGLSGQVSLSTGTLTFGSQNLGTASAAHSVTLTNTGNASLALTSVSLTGANASDFAQTNTCGNSVAANGSCAIAVTFSPTAISGRTATLMISDNATGSPQSVGLTGTGSAPTAGVSATTLTFSSQNLGTTSAAQTVTLNNTGNAALTLSSIALAGANAGDFGKTTTCGSSLAAGGNCTISVTFAPTSIGSRAASLNITDNSNNVAASVQSVGLTGTGASASVSLSPSSVAFGNQPVGVASASQSVTLTNTGNASLTLTSISVTGTNSGDFAQINACGTSLAANGSCAISVTFTPAASGSRSASISITDNATGSPQSVTLTGTGTASGVSLSPTSLTFGSQSVGVASTSQSVTLTNTGNASLTLTSISVTGTNAGDFAQTNTCGTSVAANGSCAISVTFTPAASGSRSASISIADNATSGSPQTVSLTGTGATPIAGLSPASFTFVSQPTDTSSSPESFTLSNTGTATLTITSIAFTGADPGDFAQNTTCGATLAANATCTIAVIFTPSASGSRSGSLAITDNSNSVAGSTQSSTLSGTATHDVILSWTASSSSGIAGYNIYRGASAGAESTTPLNSAPISASSYTDSGVTPGTTYYYVVTAIASNGSAQGSASNEASATVPTP
ncbi:MAG: beta strand repeat-containing protein [Terriglobia bacterium]